MNTRHLLTAAALAAVTAGCSDATGSSSRGVAIRFGTEPAAARSIGIDANTALTVALADEVVATGTNGTLKIEDIQFIVSEVELKRAENSTCVRDSKRGDDHDDDECKKFEGGPFLVDLPLGGGVVTVLQAEVPAGTFRAIEFEVEDFEMEDDDEAAEQRRTSELFAQLKTTYPNLPAGANMVVKGTFTPTTGAARPFIVYFNADIEIRQRFEEPLVVAEGGGVTVRIDPTKWFEIGNRVRDLSALNGQLVEFEFEMKQGFIKVECDR